MRRLINFVFGRNAIIPRLPKEGLWERIMTKHLLLFNTISSGGLMLFGDIAAQMVEQKMGEKEEKGLDLKRLARMTAVGTLQGPLHHYFYGWVDKWMPKNDGKTVFYKIMVDQLVAGPIFIVSYFYPAGFLEGHTMKQCNDEFKQKFWTVYKVDWIVWPPFQFINFYFLPLRYRVLYINAVTTLYDVFLCYIKHKEEKPHLKHIKD